ncbi:MAG: hypothetical protein RMK30_09115 [Anaerolineae bacterium]|nr:hypothetical protein [Anaerolineae bacterium]MDW8103022.1 hypothetical protein [Anaerolineae bacterium]
MIDVKAIIGGSLWIVGLAIILATLSWANYEAKTFRIPLRKTLTRSVFRRFMDLGLALFCLGLAMGASRWWERILWFVLSLAWLSLLLWDFRQKES